MQAVYIPRKELVFIPAGSEKGDCPYCSTGVLYKDPDINDNDKEVYHCDICDRTFMEGLSRIAWDKRYKGTKRRFFISKEIGQSRE